MRSIFIVHGSGGYPTENWFPWLKSELEAKADVKVIVPQFPVPSDDASKHIYSEWLNKLREYISIIDENTIFITHSRGCIFIMHALTELAVPKIAGLFLIAPWIQYRWYESLESKVDSFHLTPVDWTALKKLAKHIEVFQSTNDEMPVEEGIGISAMLEAHLEIVKNAGHFNTKAGYQKFELLRDNILKIL